MIPKCLYNSGAGPEAPKLFIPINMPLEVKQVDKESDDHWDTHEGSNSSRLNRTKPVGQTLLRHPTEDANN